jgi:hypothetical protein
MAGQSNIRPRKKNYRIVSNRLFRVQWLLRIVACKAVTMQLPRDK